MDLSVLHKLTYGMYAVGIDTFLGSARFLDSFFEESVRLFIFVGFSVVLL